MTNLPCHFDENNEFIIIEGITSQGKTFRPSDWAERMCDALSEFKGRRVCYSPLLRPITYNGHRSVIIHKDIVNQYPQLWEEILYFATSNDLTLTKNNDPIF
jgi:hypothetical protein